MTDQRQTYRLLIGDTVFGPMSSEDVDRVIREKRLTPDARVSVADGPWEPIVTHFSLDSDPADMPPPPETDEAPPPSRPGEWFYRKEQRTIGPMTETHLLNLLESGEISDRTFVWQHGQPEWLPLEQMRRATATVQSTVPTIRFEASLPRSRTRSTRSSSPLPAISYRVLLAVAAVAVFFPWTVASSETSGVISASSSFSFNGYQSLWGQLTLVLAIVGLVISFLDPRILPVPKSVVLSATAAVAAACPLISFLTMSSASTTGNISGMGISSQSSVDPGIGVWLALAGAAAAAGCSFFNTSNGRGTGGGDKRDSDVVGGSDSGRRRAAKDSGGTTTWLFAVVGLAFLAVTIVVAQSTRPFGQSGSATGGLPGLDPAVNSKELTKREFRDILKQLGWSGLNDLSGGIQATIPEEKLYQQVGRPTNSQTLGNMQFLYWNCKDGTIQLVRRSSFGQPAKGKEFGTIYLSAVNDY